MNSLMVLLVIYVMIGLLLTKATLWYTLAQNNDLTRVRFLMYWFAFLIVGQLWLPIASIILYHSRKRS